MLSNTPSILALGEAMVEFLGGDAGEIRHDGQDRR